MGLAHSPSPGSKFINTERYKMDLKQIKAIGGIVSDTDMEKVTKEWETPDGQKVDVSFFVLRQSFAGVERIWKEQESQDKTGRSANAALISQTVRLGSKGQQVISYEDACRLHPTLALVFINGINEALAPKKTPAPKNSSGTN